MRRHRRRLFFFIVILFRWRSGAFFRRVVFIGCAHFCHGCLLRLYVVVDVVDGGRQGLEIEYTLLVLQRSKRIYIYLLVKVGPKR